MPRKVLADRFSILVGFDNENLIDWYVRQRTCVGVNENSPDLSAFAIISTSSALLTITSLLCSPFSSSDILRFFERFTSTSVIFSWFLLQSVSAPFPRSRNNFKLTLCC